MSTGSRQGWGWSLCHNHLCTSKSSSAFLERVLSQKILDHVLKGVAWSRNVLSVLMCAEFNSRCVLVRVPSRLSYHSGDSTADLFYGAEFFIGTDLFPQYSGWLRGCGIGAVHSSQRPSEDSYLRAFGGCALAIRPPMDCRNTCDKPCRSLDGRGKPRVCLTTLRCRGYRGWP